MPNSNALKLAVSADAGPSYVELLAQTLENMPHGVVMFDAKGNLAICNRRYIEMYGLSADVVKPGCSLKALIQHRKQAGLFFGNVAQYCADIRRTIKRGQTAQQYITTTDGRTMNVVNQPIAMGGWVVTHEDVTSYRAAVAQVEYLSHHDELTALPNRALFTMHLSDALLMVDSEQYLAVHLVNLHGFRAVNAKLGYPVGDALLKAFAERLCDCVGESDIVARLGGDQFAVIQLSVLQQSSAAAMASDILQSVTKPYELDGHDVSIEAAVGIALAPVDGEAADALLHKAGLALFAANAQGDRAYRFYADSDGEGLAQDKLRAELRKVTPGAA